MSVYNEIGAGGSVVASCALITFLDQVHTAYGAGDVLYDLRKARLGVLEKIVIKKQRIVQNIKTYGELRILYTDTHNALWNEWDLVSFSVAQALAANYLQDLLSDLNQIDSCN